MVSARIPELKDCGCGIPLAAGAKIISIVFCLMNSIGFIISLYFIIKCEIDERDPNETDQQFKTTAGKEVIAALAMLICTIQGTLAFCLWYGVKEHNPSFVLPWAILTTAFEIIFTFIELLLLFLHPISIGVVMLGIVLAVMYYCVLIVYSHFRELRREQNLPQTLNDGDAA